jgi:hypothetical protein
MWRTTSCIHWSQASLSSMLGSIFNVQMTPYPSRWYVHDHELWSRLYFHHVLILLSLLPFYNTYVWLPNENDPAPDKISSEEWESNCNHKGSITQNVLACCLFDLRFQYFLSGTDGASSDATLFIDAYTPDLRVPLGRYYLAYAGFDACNSLIIPYWWVYYHLAEWGHADLRWVTIFLPQPLFLTSG